MPVWQPEPAWFDAALGSALAQVGCSVEVLVVDDGNDPPVHDLVDDPRVRVIRIDHAGASAARNAGLERSEGRFIRFVDADDVLTPDGTSQLLALADDRTIVHGATLVCDEQLEPQRTISSDLRGDVVRPCLLGRFDVRHVSMLFPAEVARAAGPWDTELRVGEDWDYVLRCVELARVVPLGEVVTLYRRHATSATRSATARADARHGQSRVLEKHFERHPGAARDGTARAARATFHDAWARRALAERAPRSFLVDALALTRVDARASTAVWRAALGQIARSIAGRVRAPAHPLAGRP